MAYASIAGRCSADVNNPISQAVCDRCGIWTPHNKLNWQMAYRGRSLQNIRLLVCDLCNDEPNPQTKPRVIPPDPIPTPNARVEAFCSDNVDERTTTNPALPAVDFGTSAPILLSGLQFIDGHQLQEGELVLVMGQTNPAQNGIYKVGTGVWTLQGFDNDKHVYIPAASIDTSWTGGVLYLQQLGVYMGAVYVARGLYTGRLYQIDFLDTAGVVGTGGVIANFVPAFSVNRIDLYTGIYMTGQEAARITEDDFVRTTQQVGQASGNLNEIPGWSDLVPGSCKEEIGSPDAVPYGCATKQGLPPSMVSLPFSGALWGTVSNQSISVWLNNSLRPFKWTNNLGIEVTFNQTGFWPNPGPGAPFRPVSTRAAFADWVNLNQVVMPWQDTAGYAMIWGNGVLTENFPPGGDNLWTNDKCDLVMWHNRAGDQVDFAEIYPNAIKPNAPAPWPWGF